MFGSVRGPPAYTAPHARSGTGATPTRRPGGVSPLRRGKKPMKATAAAPARIATTAPAAPVVSASTAYGRPSSTEHSQSRLTASSYTGSVSHEVSPPPRLPGTRYRDSQHMTAVAGTSGQAPYSDPAAAPAPGTGNTPRGGSRGGAVNSPRRASSNHDRRASSNHRSPIEDSVHRSTPRRRPSPSAHGDRITSTTLGGSFVTPSPLQIRRGELVADPAEPKGKSRRLAILVAKVNKAPESCDAWCGLGYALDAGESVFVACVATTVTKQQCFLRGIECDAGSVAAWNNLGFTMGQEESVKVRNDDIGLRDHVTKKDCFVRAVEAASTILANSQPPAAPSASDVVGGSGRGGDSTKQSSTSTMHQGSAAAPREPSEMEIIVAAAWGNLGFTVAPSETVTVDGEPLSRTQCFARALEMDPSDSASWNNAGFALADADPTLTSPHQSSVPAASLPQETPTRKLLTDALSPVGVRSGASAAAGAIPTVTVHGEQYTKKDCFTMSLEIDEWNSAAWAALGHCCLNRQPTLRHTRDHSQSHSRLGTERQTIGPAGSGSSQVVPVPAKVNPKKPRQPSPKARPGRGRGGRSSAARSSATTGYRHPLHQHHAHEVDDDEVQDRGDVGRADDKANDEVSALTQQQQEPQPTGAGNRTSESVQSVHRISARLVDTPDLDADGSQPPEDRRGDSAALSAAQSLQRAESQQAPTLQQGHGGASTPGTSGAATATAHHAAPGTPGAGAGAGRAQLPPIQLLSPRHRRVGGSPYRAYSSFGGGGQHQPQADAHSGGRDGETPDPRAPRSPRSTTPLGRNWPTGQKSPRRSPRGTPYAPYISTHASLRGVTPTRVEFADEETLAAHRASLGNMSPRALHDRHPCFSHLAAAAAAAAAGGGGGGGGTPLVRTPRGTPVDTPRSGRNTPRRGQKSSGFYDHHVSPGDRDGRGDVRGFTSNSPGSPNGARAATDPPLDDDAAPASPHPRVRPIVKSKRQQQGGSSLSAAFAFNDGVADPDALSSHSSPLLTERLYDPVTCALVAGQVFTAADCFAQAVTVDVSNKSAWKALGDQLGTGHCASVTLNGREKPFNRDECYVMGSHVPPPNLPPVDAYTPGSTPKMSPSQTPHRRGSDAAFASTVSPGGPTTAPPPRPSSQRPTTSSGQFESQPPLHSAAGCHQNHNMTSPERHHQAQRYGSSGHEVKPSSSSAAPSHFDTHGQSGFDVSPDRSDMEADADTLPPSTPVPQLDLSRLASKNRISPKLQTSTTPPLHSSAPAGNGRNGTGQNGATSSSSGSGNGSGNGSNSTSLNNTTNGRGSRAGSDQRAGDGTTRSRSGSRRLSQGREGDVVRIAKPSDVRAQKLRSSIDHVRDHPTSADGWMDLGIALEPGQRAAPLLDGSAPVNKQDCFVHAVHHDPTKGQAWYHLAKATDRGEQVLLKDGEIVDRKQCFLEAVRHSPEDSEAWNNLGTQLRGKERVRARPTSAPTAPTNADGAGARASTGGVDRGSDQEDQGMVSQQDCFIAAVEAKPSNATAWQNLCKTLRRPTDTATIRGLPMTKAMCDEAAKGHLPIGIHPTHVRPALAMLQADDGFNNAEAWSELGKALADDEVVCIGREDIGKKEAFRRCVALEPRSAAAWFNLAHSIRAESVPAKKLPGDAAGNPMDVHSDDEPINGNGSAVFEGTPQSQSRRGSSVGSPSHPRRATRRPTLPGGWMPVRTGMIAGDPGLEDVLVFKPVEVHGEVLSKQQCYVEALKHSPLMSTAWNNLGATLGSEDDTVSVDGERVTQQECYIRAIDTDPTNAIAWHNLGETLQSDGHDRVAVRCWVVDQDDCERAATLGVLPQRLTTDPERLSEFPPEQEKALRLSPMRRRSSMSDPHGEQNGASDGQIKTGRVTSGDDGASGLSAPAHAGGGQVGGSGSAGSAGALPLRGAALCQEPGRRDGTRRPAEEDTRTATPVLTAGPSVDEPMHYDTDHIVTDHEGAGDSSAVVLSPASERHRTPTPTQSIRPHNPLDSESPHPVVDVSALTDESIHGLTQGSSSRLPQASSSIPEQQPNNDGTSTAETGVAQTLPLSNGNSTQLALQSNETKDEMGGVHGGTVTADGTAAAAEDGTAAMTNPLKGDFGANDGDPTASATAPDGQSSSGMVGDIGADDLKHAISTSSGHRTPESRTPMGGEMSHGEATNPLQHSVSGDKPPLPPTAPVGPPSALLTPHADARAETELSFAQGSSIVQTPAEHVLSPNNANGSPSPAGAPAAQAQAPHDETALLAVEPTLEHLEILEKIRVADGESPTPSPTQSPRPGQAGSSPHAQESSKPAGVGFGVSASPSRRDQGTGDGTVLLTASTDALGLPPRQPVGRDEFSKTGRNRPEPRRRPNSVGPIAQVASMWFNLGNAIPSNQALALSDGTRLTRAQCYARSLTIDPRNSKAWYNLGRVLGLSQTIDVNGETVDRRACYKNAVEYDPGDSEAWNNFGCTLHRNEKVEIFAADTGRRDCFIRAILLWNGNRRAWRNLSRVIDDTDVVAIGSSKFTRRECEARAAAPATGAADEEPGMSLSLNAPQMPPGFMQGKDGQLPEMRFENRSPSGTTMSSQSVLGPDLNPVRPATREEASLFLAVAQGVSDDAGPLSDSPDVEMTPEDRMRVRAKKHSMAWYNLGNALGDKDRVRIGNREYTRQSCFLEAVKCDPTYTHAWYNLGTTMRRKQRVAFFDRRMTKQDCYMEAVRTNVFDAGAWNNLGTSMLSGDRVIVGERAFTQREVFRQAVKLNPNIRPAWRNLGRSLCGPEVVVVHDETFTSQDCLDIAAGAARPPQALLYDSSIITPMPSARRMYPSATPATPDPQAPPSGRSSFHESALSLSQRRAVSSQGSPSRPPRAPTSMRPVSLSEEALEAAKITSTSRTSGPPSPAVATGLDLLALAPTASASVGASSRVGGSTPPPAVAPPGSSTLRRRYSAVVAPTARTSRRESIAQIQHDSTELAPLPEKNRRIAQSLSVNPHQPALWFKLGCALAPTQHTMVAGDPKTQRDCFIESLVRGETAEAWFNLGKNTSFGELVPVGGFGEFSRADCLCRSLELEPDDGEAWNDLGTTMRSTTDGATELEVLTDTVIVNGAPVTQRDCFAHAVELAPTAGAWANLGFNLGDDMITLHGHGRSMGAVGCFVAALKLDKDSSRAWFNLGMHLRQQRHQTADGEARTVVVNGERVTADVCLDRSGVPMEW